MVSSFGRPAAGVEAVELVGLCVPVDGEEIAAHAVHHGFGHAQHRVGRDARIDGRTAALEDARAGLRCLDIAGGHNAVWRDHHAAAVVALLRDGDRQEQDAEDEQRGQGIAHKGSHESP